MKDSPLGIQHQCLKRRLLWNNKFLSLNFNFYGNSFLVWRINFINLRQMSQNFGSWWKFSLMLRAKRSIFIAIIFFRTKWAFLPFPFQNPRNRLGHWGPTVLIAQQPNSQESLYKYSPVSGIGIAKGRAWSLRHDLKPCVPELLLLKVHAF